MASVQAYTVHGRRYWRIVESFRDAKGRPKLRVLRHLGTAETLLTHLSEAPGKSLHAEQREFGGAAALWDIAQELGVVEIIDRHAPKRDQGASVGQYMLLAAINRALAPASKSQLSSWYESTILRRLLPLPQPALRPQRFWDHMKYLKPGALAAIETDLTRTLVENFGVDVGSLFYDATNFDTFLASDNPSELAQRGHSKSKRTDLRIVGLALLVSWDFHIPLFSQVYEGNQPDSVTFAQALDDLTARYQIFRERCQRITLVMDKGNNSQDNIEALDASPYYLIGSLVPSQHPDLLDIPLKKFHPLPGLRFKGLRVCRVSKSVFGQTRTLLITRSKALLDGQVRGIRQHLKKKLRLLEELQQRVQVSHQPGWRGKPYTEESLKAKLKDIASGQYIREFLSASVTRDRGGHLAVEFATNHEAYRKLKTRLLGKRILFTNFHELTDEQIVFGYRGQHHVEAAFRNMKDPYFIRFSPAFHWTDDMIRVHAFYCILALTLTALLYRRIRAANIDLTQTQMLRQLKDIREITNYYAPLESRRGGRPRSDRALSRLNAEQEQLFKTLRLERFLAS